MIAAPKRYALLPMLALFGAASLSVAWAAPPEHLVPFPEDAQRRPSP